MNSLFDALVFSCCDVDEEEYFLDVLLCDELNNEENENECES